MSLFPLPKMDYFPLALRPLKSFEKVYVFLSHPMVYGPWTAKKTLGVAQIQNPFE